MSLISGYRGEYKPSEPVAPRRAKSLKLGLRATMPVETSVRDRVRRRVKAEPGLMASEIAQRVGVPAKVVVNALGSLVRYGRAEARRSGKYARYYPTEKT